MLAQYGATRNMLSLNTQIHHCFMKAVTPWPGHRQMQLATLPPTSASAREHSWRTYHQVQSWLGNEGLSSDWGWDLVNGQLHPVLTRLRPT